MSENVNSEGEEKNKFNYDDLTPFEHLMIGSSTKILINGNVVNVNSEALEKLWEDEDARRTILTPINLTQSKRTMGEVLQARENGRIPPAISLPLFKFEPQQKYIDGNIYPTFEPGKLGENGQLETFGISFVRVNPENNSKTRFPLPDNPEEEMPLHKNFVKLVKYIGKKNGRMNFLIKGGI